MIKQVSDEFIKKNVELSLEFDMYLLEHLELSDEMPDKTWVVITIDGDETFNTTSRSLVRNPKRKTIVEAHKSGKGWSIRPLAAKTS